MADEIEIVNVGGEKGVASDATLRRLLSTMERMAKDSGKDPKSQAAKLQRAYEKALKESTKAVDESTDAYEDNTSAVRSATSALGGMAGFVGGAVLNALGSLTGSVVGIGKELITGGNRLSDFAQHVPLVGGVLSTFTGLLDQSIDQLRAFSGVGASFNNDMEEMIRGMIGTEMPFDEFANVVINNSAAMAALGTSVTQGTQRFARLSRDLRTSNLGSELLNMGFTMQDVSAGLASYTMMQARAGRLENMRNEDLIAGTGRYLREVDALTKATGIQRSEAEALINRQQTDAQVRAVEREIRARGGNVEAFKAQMAVLDSLGPQLGGALKGMIDGVPDDDFAEMLYVATNGASAELMRQARTQQISTAEFINGLAALAPTIDSTFNSPELIGGLRRLGHVGAQVADENYRLQELTEKSADEILAEQNRRNASTSALLQFEQAMASLRSEVLLPLVNAFMPPFSEFMKNTFTEANIQTYVNNFKNFMTEFQEDPKGKFLEVFGNIKTAFMDWMFGEIVEGTENRTGGFWKDVKDAFMNLMFGEIDKNDPSKRVGGLFDTISSAFTNFWNDPAVRANVDVFFVGMTNMFGRLIDSLVEKYTGGLAGTNLGDNTTRTAIERLQAGETLTDEERQDLIQTIRSQINARARESDSTWENLKGYAGSAISGLTDWAVDLGNLDAMVYSDQDILRAWNELNPPQRSIGTFAATGRMTEPTDVIAKIHAGERVLNPQEAAAYNNLTTNSNGVNVNSNLPNDPSRDAIRELAASIRRGQEELRNDVNQLNNTMSQATIILGEIKNINRRHATATENIGSVY